MKDLEKDPNLKKKRDDPKGDSSLALKVIYYKILKF